MAKIPDGANGVLPLRLGWAGALMRGEIVGGPFHAYAKRHAGSGFGLCLTEHRQAGTTAHLPINDFSVPRDKQVVNAVLLLAFGAMRDGRPVWVGCAGGWGRTGLLLALMAKTAGVAEPVAYVRRHYSMRAVETPGQEAYVRTFDVTWVRRQVNRHAWRRRMTPWVRRARGFTSAAMRAS